MFSTKSLRPSSLALGCLLVAAVGCGQERKVVDAEQADGVAVGMGGAGSRGSKAAGAMVEAAGSAGAAEVLAAEGGEPQTASVAPVVDEEEEDYGWVRFEHAPFGDGTTPNAELRRKIRVTIFGDETTMVGRGYVMRSSLTTPYVGVALAITNGNPDLRCFVKAESIVWKTADGEVIPGDEPGPLYLSGSLGDSGDSPTTTCLGPGEKGYFLANQWTRQGKLPLFDSLAEIELVLSSSESSFQRPKHRVLPTRWRGSKRELAVTFRNMGAASAPIELAHGQFILTDADGQPLTWGFLDLNTGLKLLGAGETLLLTSDIQFDGKASNLLASFGY